MLDYDTIDYSDFYDERDTFCFRYRVWDNAGHKYGFIIKITAEALRACSEFRSLVWHLKEIDEMYRQPLYTMFKIIESRPEDYLMPELATYPQIYCEDLALLIDSNKKWPAYNGVITASIAKSLFKDIENNDGK